ncbi:MAG: TIGR02453 family protein, partial [Pseudomonadota bacterium]
MSDPFATLIPDARAFLSDLAANNTRDWFAAHKSQYESALKTPAAHLLDQIAADFARDHRETVKPKLFRPHRDVRFSKDKTPYHTHLHLLWQVVRDGAAPGYFFGIAPDYVRIGGGMMGFDKPALTAFRTAVDGTAGDALKSILATASQSGLEAGDPELKRVPAPFDADHPRADLLRRKGLTVWT